jgi:2-polyprenyl-6-methoxyphenol hydroxylase-like FAD-dependent oxidoreductase
MSPVGGVGINYAIQDAVVAANVLTEPLLAGHVGRAPLVQVQLERELPTIVIQSVQNVLSRLIFTTATRGGLPIPAWLLRAPLLRDLAGRLIGFGIWRVHVAQP